MTTHPRPAGQRQERHPSRSRLRWLALTVTLAFAASSCAPGASPAELARDRWEALDARDFVLTLDASCEGSGCGVLDARYEVLHRSGDVVGAFAIREIGDSPEKISPIATNLLPNVEELLALAERSRPADFDEITGVPTSVLRGTIEFENIQIVFDIDDARQELETSRETWRRAGLGDYLLTYRWPCACPRAGFYEIEVRGGVAVEEVARRSLDGIPTTVEELFDVIDRALGEDLDTFDLRYSDTGAPVLVSIDLDLTTARQDLRYARIGVELIE